MRLHRLPQPRDVRRRATHRLPAALAADASGAATSAAAVSTPAGSAASPSRAAARPAAAAAAAVTSATTDPLAAAAAPAAASGAPLRVPAGDADRPAEPASLAEGLVLGHRLARRVPPLLDIGGGGEDPAVRVEPRLLRRGRPHRPLPAASAAPQPDGQAASVATHIAANPSEPAAVPVPATAAASLSGTAAAAVRLLARRPGSRRVGGPKHLLSLARSPRAMREDLRGESRRHLRMQIHGEPEHGVPSW